MGYAKTLSSAKLTRWNLLEMSLTESAKAIADLKKGGLDDLVNDEDHRKTIMNAAKRVLKVLQEGRTIEL
jgi:hypothetical protein